MSEGQAVAKQIKFEVKSGLAKLLAAENITMQHDPASKTAYFDIKTRVLVLPVWENISEDLYDMLVVHEVGHALYTPETGWRNAVNDIARKAYPKATEKELFDIKPNVQGFLNVVEDARIDKLQKRRYPGTKRNYVVGYKELTDDLDFFGLKAKDVNSLIFIDRANVYFKSTGIHINFSAQERSFISRMEKLETFEEVVALTEEIFLMSKEELSKMQAQKKSDQAEEGEEGEDIEIDIEMDEDDARDLMESQSKNGDSSKGKESDKELDKEGQQKNKSNVRVNIKVKPSEKKENEGEKKTEATDSPKGAGASKAVEVPKSYTEEKAQESAKKIVSNDNVVFQRFTIPTFIIDNVADDFSKVIPQIESEITLRVKSNTWYSDTWAKSQKEFIEWRRSETDNLSYMVKEFEMRKAADAYSKIRISKTGIIDTNKLVRYKFDDDLFRKNTVVPQGKNHGFFLIMDWSGSMTSNLRNTVKQLLSLVLFCKRVNIPFEVYLFRTGGTHVDVSTYSPQGKIYSNNPSNFSFGAFKLRNILSSRMNNTTFMKACQIMWHFTNGGMTSTDPLNGTPLNQAILVASDLIKKFNKDNKIQISSVIILTDGQSDASGMYLRPIKAGMQIRYNIPNRYILEDPETRKTYWLNNTGGYEVTSTYLRVLKDRTNSTIVGFYLHPGSSMNGLHYFLDETVLNSEANKTSWKENKFFSVKKLSGYDEQYVISTVQTSAKDNELKVNSTMTDRVLTKNFINFAAKKRVNRVLLNSFVERIAKETVE